jgi:CheY-like chemotaxis protein
VKVYIVGDECVPHEGGEPVHVVCASVDAALQWVYARQAADDPVWKVRVADDVLIERGWTIQDRDDPDDPDLVVMDVNVPEGYRGAEYWIRVHEVVV